MIIRYLRSAVFPSILLIFLLSVTASVKADDRQPVWSDEFNGNEIDQTLWTWDEGGHGWGNGQLEYNTARRENSYIKDGNLVIEARRESFRGRQFTSARMHTQGRFAFQYGSLEARIRVPNTANGIWPAFWMLGNNHPGIIWPRCGEIDILEIGGKEGIRSGLQQRHINCALHFAGQKEKTTSLVAWHTSDEELHTDYHVYRLDWTRDRIRVLLDGQEYGNWNIEAPEFREFHQPFFPILNLAVGSWVSSYTAIDTPAKVTAKFPARMHIDWVRLYANEDTRILRNPLPAATPTGLAIHSENPRTMDRLPLTDFGARDFAYGNRGALLLWNNVKPSGSPRPFEGEECWSFQIGKGQWFGLGVLAAQHRNMTSYSNGALTFSIQTRSALNMKVGIKSSAGESWIPIGNEASEFGFRRDGQWHRIRVPLTRLKTDLRTVHQFFMLAGEAPESEVMLAIDDIRWEPGPKTE